jgi:hypothetical protein
MTELTDSDIINVIRAERATADAEIKRLSATVADLTAANAGCAEIINRLTCLNAEFVEALSEILADYEYLYPKELPPSALPDRARAAIAKAKGELGAS